MNRWRIAGLLLVAALAASLYVWQLFAPEPDVPAPEVPPPRESFHASKALRVIVAAEPQAVEQIAWLDHELRQLMNRARMRLAPAAQEDTFALRVELAENPRRAKLSLIAPDRKVEREEQVPLEAESRLEILRALAQRLPSFLDAVHGASSWAELIGTGDPRAYDIYLDNAMQLLGPHGQGFTRPADSPRHARAIERLEALSRRQPEFARAWAALAAGYLSLGGQDENSLSQLAESSVKRALALDDELGEAHAALGLVHLRRNEWIAAREQFDRALALDVNSVPALEGFGCLLVDAGQYAQARPMLARALTLQPGNIGAGECLAYSDVAAGESVEETRAASAAVVYAVADILAGERASARQRLRRALDRNDYRAWAEPLLQAASDRESIPEALRAITRAANDERIDAATEILCGAALRQAEFVFNRMSRLQRQRETVPLRVLWMPQTAFLRRHARLDQVIGTAGLQTFWQEYGAPDICASEPAVSGCKVRVASPAK